MFFVVLTKTASMIESMDSSSLWLRIEFAVLYTIELNIDMLRTPSLAAAEKPFLARTHWAAISAFDVSQARVLAPELSVSYIPPKKSVDPESCTRISCATQHESHVIVD